MLPSIIPRFLFKPVTHRVLIKVFSDRMIVMGMELSSLFAGRKVDLRTPQELSRYFRDEVAHEAEIQYDAS
jgi:hypothetical protein